MAATKSIKKEVRGQATWYTTGQNEYRQKKRKLNQCNGEFALKGFEVMMAACRSVISRGKVSCCRSTPANRNWRPWRTRYRLVTAKLNIYSRENPLTAFST
jgi:hypothetical protein